MPSWGRWLSPDPAGFVDGPNLCRFCLNNPLSFIDWLGEESESHRGDDLYGKGGPRGVKPEDRVHSNGGSGFFRALLTAGGIAAAKYGRKVWNWMFHSGGEDLRLPERRWLVSLDGTTQMAGGLFEMSYGVTCCCTVVGAPLGAFLILHGFDHLVAGARRVTTGVHVDIVTCRLLQEYGFSPANAGLIDNGISIIGTLGAAFALRAFRAAAIGAGELVWVTAGSQQAIRAAKPLGTLTKIGENAWESSGGLRYVGVDPRGMNRVQHILEHTKPNPLKRVHSVFNVSENQVFGLLDEAWRIRGSALPDDPSVFILSRLTSRS